MTYLANDLALSLINENTPQFPYDQRVVLAQTGPNSGGIYSTASQWTGLLNNYAKVYAAAYGVRFKPSDIVSAAAHVAEYYERHVAESETA